MENISASYGGLSEVEGQWNRYTFSVIITSTVLTTSNSFWRLVLFDNGCNIVWR